ncbi:MAG: VWA domain-containing protein, partial [Planctomycetota bacterium JB042]
MSAAGFFLRPELGAALLLVPAAAVVALVLERRRAARLARAVGPRARWLARETSPGARRVRGALLLAAAALAIVAAMEPRWGVGPRRVEQRGVDLVVCLDVSRSMRARDLPPDRLTAATDGIRRLAGRGRGDRFALVVFAGEARLAVPRTRDAATFASLAERAGPSDVARGGTDLGAALETALEALGDAGGEHEAIVLLSDGEDHGARGLAAAAACRARGVAVHAVGYGTAWGGKIPLGDGPDAGFLADRAGREVVTALDGAGLRRIAEATGGAFVDASVVGRPLELLYDSRITAQARRAFEAATREERTTRFQWPLLVAILLLLIALARTGRARRDIAGTTARREGAAVAAALPLLVLALVAAGAAAVDGERALREGRFAEAHDAFAAAVAAAGDEAPAELLWNEALAALAAGRPREAEIAAEVAAVRGGTSFGPRRDFVLGSAAWARAARAEAQASGPEAEPFAFDLAIAQVDAARDAWA